ncbi:MAG: hypothetical protein ACYDCI_06565 [Candidatus Limnocylindrales bacterium]
MNRSAVRAQPYVRRFPVIPIVTAFLLPLGVLYVLSYVSPAIEWHSLTGEGTGDGKFLFDSIGYYETAQRLSLSQLFAVASAADWIRGLGLTNIALFAQGKVAQSAFPWDPSVGIFLLNVLIFGVGVRNALAIARELGVELSPLAKLTLFLNPAVLLSTVSLTKEIWGLALITGFSLAAIRHRWVTLGVLAVISLFVREYYPVVAVFVALLTKPKLQPWILLVAVAFFMGFLESVLGFGDLTGFLALKAEQLGQQTATLMHTMGQVQSIPFGHIIAFPIVLAVNIASPMFNPASYATPVDAFFVQATTISSYLSVGLLLVGASRHWRRRDLHATDIVWRHLFGFAVLLTLYPISQHRYWLAAYPLLVVWALANDKNRDSKPDLSIDGSGLSSVLVPPKPGSTERPRLTARLSPFAGFDG